MQTAIGVRFKKASPIIYYRPSYTVVNKGDWVIAETDRGLECGRIVLGPAELVADTLQLRTIRRRATPNDLAKHAENKRREKEAFVICKKKIADHKLPMKLIGVEFTFDVSKIIFSFTAEGRVDFRELVRDLAYVFRTRIELRQVGVRDETKLMGGIGNCGRPLCCASFLGDFVTVSIRMAKDQKLSLNPTKISGCCGRLMCCLQYEDENYREGCGLCCGESAINNLNADDDSAALEKLEALEIAEEKLDQSEGSETKAKEVRSVARQNERSSSRAAERSTERGSDRAGSRATERRRPSGSRGAERGSDRSSERGAERSTERNRMQTSRAGGGSRPGGSRAGARTSEAASEQSKRPPSKGKPRPKKSAYQRDKNFHARRPDLDDV